MTNLIPQLAECANQLDQAGLVREATTVTSILKRVAAIEQVMSVLGPEASMDRGPACPECGGKVIHGEQPYCEACHWHG